MNGFFQRNKWLYFIHIFFVKHFKVTKNRILPQDRRIQWLIGKMNILYQGI